LKEYSWQPNEVAPIVDAMAELMANDNGSFMPVQVSTLKTIVEKCWNIQEGILKALVALL
jgi:DNA-binding transcriptional regulator PaaX